MKTYKVSVFICSEENTMDLKVDGAIYPIGFTEAVASYLIPKYLNLLSIGVFYAVHEDECDVRGVFNGVWEVESNYDLDKVL